MSRPVVPLIAAALNAAALCVAGCSGSVTDPFYVASGTVPSGLSVTSTVTGPAIDSLPGGPTVTAAGDSVAVAARISPDQRCSVFTASAGVEGGTLVVTSVSTWQTAPCVIALIAYGPNSAPVFRAVVRSVPRGRYTVVVRERIQTSAGGTEFRERELTRGSVTLK